jgi:hypothetical protein
MELDALLPLDVVVMVSLSAAVFDAVSSSDAIDLGAGRTTPTARPAIECFCLNFSPEVRRDMIGTRLACCMA